MAKLLVYDITTEKNQPAVLRKTLKQFTQACMAVAKYADAKSQYDPRTLEAALKSDIQEAFHLPTGLIVGVCRRVGHDFTRLNPDVARGTRRRNLPDYEGNRWILYTDSTASVRMDAAHPADDVADYEFLLSLTNVGTRMTRLPFKPSSVPLPVGEGWHNKEMRLCASDGGKKWSLRVAVGVTDEIEDEEDPTMNPDYQGPDYTPLEDDGYGYVSPDEAMD